MKRTFWGNAGLAVAIFLLNFGLNTPLFMRGDSPYRDSIEGGYASMARFVTAHPDPWGWNPTQYCGLPTQFMYLPALPYATAVVSWLSSAPPEYVYRLITATLACLGPVTLFLFALYFTRSRWWALAAALGYTFFSPLYGLASQVDKDRGGIAQLPWRMQVLVKYGEGPHNAGLTLLPLALVAVWVAGTGRRYWQVLVAAVLLAAIPLTNWVAALALGLCCLLLMAAALSTRKDFATARALAAAALAYLLACFWLTPTFIRTIAFNWPTDSFGYRLGPPQALSALGLVVCAALQWRWLVRSGVGFYRAFVNLAALVFAWIVLGHYWFGVDLLPESRRYAIELEFFLMLAFVEWLRADWERNRKVAVVAMMVIVLLGSRQAWKYVTQNRQIRTPWPLDSTVEYPLARWLAAQPIAGRVFASGGLRFRLNSWFPVPQVSGGFESGLTTRTPVDLYYQVRTGSANMGRGPIDMLSQLKTLGAEYVVVHGPKSREHYRDFANPRQFDGVLPAVFHIEDDTVYRLPVTSLAHAVRDAELPRWHKPPALDAYVAALDDAARPRLRTTWHDASTLSVEGAVPAGMLVSVQVNHDPGWQCTQDGRTITPERDGLGFLVLRPAPAPFTRLELRYRGTLEQRLMAGFSALAWLAALTGLWWTRRVRYWKHDPVDVIQ